MEESGLELPESNPHSNNEFRSLLESASNSSDRKDINSSTEFSDSSSDASSTHEKISDPLPVKHEVTYWSLVRDNRPYRLYLASYITNYFGKFQVGQILKVDLILNLNLCPILRFRKGVWLTYLSSLTAIHYIHASQQDDLSEEKNVNTAISYLVVVRLMTNFFFSPLGGVLADAFCRRKVMILLDLLGAISSFVFILAIAFKSIYMIYFATFLQQVFSGLYDPSRSALLPLLTKNDEAQMQKATILSGMAWSAVAALGSSLGGFIVSIIGLQACFVVDSLTYLVSANLMYCVGEGEWNVSKKTDANSSSQRSGVIAMLLDMALYLSESFLAPLILSKFFLLYGSESLIIFWRDDLTWNMSIFVHTSEIFHSLDDVGCRECCFCGR